MKGKVQIVAGVISLMALLTYTLVHTGGLLSSYVQPGFVGYIAAFGIELAIVSLSLRIGDLRKANQNVGFFLFVLVSVVIVSALANIAEGFRLAQGERLTALSVRRLDAVQAVIGLSATGLVSLIVLALSEIIGTDVNAIVQGSERKRKPAARTVSSATGLNATPEQAELARDAKAEQDAQKKAERLDTLLNIYRDNPNVGVSEAARLLGIGRTTMYTYLSELEQAGRIHRNGDGVQVVEG